MDPREGTVSGPGGIVRLEPKVMEVLSVLAEHPGRVVSRDDLLERVWPGVVVTEHTLSRCIYQLRSGLKDVGPDAGDTDFKPIETLPKRGYRLLVTVHGMETAAPRPPGDAQTPVVPFVVGQWVRGERFYGRSAQISEILDGPRNCIWLLGTRRIGKTSLLKQIEYMAETDPDRSYMPIFWDFQGADSPAELHRNFADALLDADERLERAGIALADVESDDLFVSIERLRRQLRSRKMKLLLLCDEVEELIELQRKDPSLLRKLRHAMQSREDIRTVLASTVRLWALANSREDTSPFLHGFTPPLYIQRFSDEEARSLIEQSHLAPSQQPHYADGVADGILVHCDNHPFLVQLVCKRYFEIGSLEEAIERVATDRMVSYFFSVDFEMLSPAERGIVETIARQSPATTDSIAATCTLDPDALSGNLRRLEDLGFIRSANNTQFELANSFFRRWLRSTKEPVLPPTATAAIAIGDEGAAADTARAAQGFLTELKRRNVFRVGIIYVVAGWLMLQLGEILFQFLQVPEWAGKLLVALLALGFPFALFLAWVFELTPEGVMRETEVDHSSLAAGRTHRRLNYVIAVILAIAVLIYAVDKFA
ncbi:MAG: winged helix-turn-helix domain-containing protein [Gammaproteobacteria bacterium]|nr:winged helix-turn-helix domain-containing protein [Gammaproteobacteria bacterium]